jgi:cysteine desulfurase / selenocysteine lyase
MTTERFSQVPQNLRRALGKLIEAPAEDIILGNSASYGLHLLANGIRWKTGGEILLYNTEADIDQALSVLNHI